MLPTAVRLSLLTQIVLTLGAIAPAVVAMTSSPTVRISGMAVSSGVAVSTPVIACGVLLLVAGMTGLIALRSHRFHLRASIILLTPLVLAVATSLSTSSSDQAWSGFGVEQSIEDTLRLLEWSSWLILAAVLLSAVSAAFLLVIRKGRLQSERRM